MDWLIRHYSQVEHFLQDPAFYAEPLQQMLGISFPLRTTGDCEVAYRRVLPFVRTTKNALQAREQITFCFALLLAHFFVRTAGHRCEMRKKDIGSGPFWDLVIVFAQGENLHKVSVVSSVVRVLHGKSKEPFRNFWWHLTGIPTQDPI